MNSEQTESEEETSTSETTQRDLADVLSEEFWNSSSHDEDDLPM